MPVSIQYFFLYYSSLKGREGPKIDSSLVYCVILVFIG